MNHLIQVTSHFLHWRKSIISMGRLKPIIKPFDSGWNYILHLSFKLISLLVIWSWKYNNVLKEKNTSLQTLVIRICQATLNIFPDWISKHCIQKYKNHSKMSSGAGRFAQNLCACKKSQYNVWNFKSGRHNRRHTFRRCNSRYRSTSTNIPYYSFKVKERKKGNTKVYFLVDNIECSMQSIIVTIIISAILQEYYHLFYLSMNRTYVMITYL